MILIKGCKAVDPKTGTERIADVLVRDGKIAMIRDRIEAAAIEGADEKPAEGTEKEGENLRVIRGAGLTLAPGLIDVHVHLKKKDRYEYHRKLNATEYKQKIVTMIDDKLEAIIETSGSLNPMYRMTAEYVLNNLKRRYIETNHRSTGKKIAFRDSKIKDLEDQLES